MSLFQRIKGRWFKPSSTKVVGAHCASRGASTINHSCRIDVPTNVSFVAPNTHFFTLPPVPDVPQAQRLASQAVAILDRLSRGRASNRDLAGISLKYTGRISDLRKAGHDIVCVEHNRKTGVAFYELRGTV